MAGTSASTVNVSGNLALGGTVTNNGTGGGTTINGGGVLTLGVGGASGMVTGNIIDNGTLAFNRSDVVTYSNVIPGTGNLVQEGSGTTVFSTNQTYTGATTISAGTLQLGNGGTTGQIASTSAVTDDGTLAFNFSNTVTFGNVISGTGAVSQLGSGTTIFTGDNTYSGATTISAGTLQLGNGGTTGSIVGPVVDNASLVIDNSGTVTLPGVISGTGALNQLGSGTTILTGDNTYTGGTTISAGVLQLGSGGTTGSIVGVVLDNTSLVIDNSSTVTLPGVISGSGALSQIGSGTTILTADNTYTGDTTITAGTLQLGNGGTSGSIVGDVTDNGTLAFDRTDDVTFAGTISGTGALNQMGSGTTILTADNTYTGDTTITAGTLQLGNGGTSGSIVGDVTDNGTLAFDRTDNVTFAGTISGTGALDQIGSGTTILTGDNTYSGGTTISAGVLQLGNGGTTGSIVGAVVDNTSLVVDNSGSVILPGTISGSGALSQIGSGTTILTADNTYTGGTTISAGTLQLGNGGTTGSIVGNVTDNGTLAFDRTDNVTFAGTISGTGALNQMGSGTTILTADNTYTGGTTISAGTLQLGNGGTTGSIVGNVIDNGTLAFDRTDNVTFAGTISGTGALNQMGSGTTILTADNTYTGGATISAGTLQLGSGGTSGSIVGNVTDNGTLAFDRTDNVTFAGTVSGTGALNQIGSGTMILTADNTYTGGTTISAGTLQLGNGGTTGSIVGPVVDNTSLVIDNSSTVTLPGVISGSGTLSQIGSGTTILTSDNTYSGGTTISAGTLQLGNGGTSGSIVGNVTDNGMLVFNRSDDISYSNIVSGSGGLTQLGPGTLTLQGAQTYTGPTDVLGGVLELDGSIQSATATVGANGTLSGFGDIYANVTNQGTIWPGHAIVGDTNYGALTIHGNYVGNNGALELNTFLGTDGSPSDQLVIDGGTATGSTTVIVHNTSTSSGETTGNGILVVSAINGATTASNAFQLGGEDRGGALDYALFHGSQDGTDPNSWYLRNEFVVPGPGPTPQPLPGLPVLPPDPPPASLPPGVYPIIGPEVATYGSVQPVAVNLGLFTLGTMDQRIGDSALMASANAASDPGPSAWARVLGGNMDNTYREFAAPSVRGELSGMQVGADIWQGQAFPGLADRFGGYVSYSNADMSVRGLIADVANLDYVRVSTGTVDMHATSAGAYFTHYGISGWYLDAVTQFTSYNGRATTQYDSLPTKGTGIIGSLEFGYPIALPQLGSSFVLEPQAQAIWQHTNFAPTHDSASEIQLGSTYGTTGRLGLRGKWQITTDSGQVWSPYVTTNFWRDWGGRSATVFGATANNFDTAPMVPQATRAELEGGVTAKLLAKLIVYGSLGYEHQLGNGTDAQREGFNGQVGVRYT